MEAPGATGEFQPTSQDVMPPAAVSTSGRPEVQPPGPTTQPAFAANQSTLLTSVPASQDELVSDEDKLSDHPSPSLDEEGELSDIQSTGPDQEDFSRSKVSSWTNQPARLNSSFPQIANRSLPSAPASRPVSQDTLRKWERAVRDQSNVQSGCWFLSLLDQSTGLYDYPAENYTG